MSGYNVYKKMENGEVVDVEVGNTCPDGFQFVIHERTFTKALHVADAILAEQQNARPRPIDPSGIGPSAPLF